MILPNDLEQKLSEHEKSIEYTENEKSIEYTENMKSIEYTFGTDDIMSLNISKEKSR